jgi:hypothetical protein
MPYPGNTPDCREFPKRAPLLLLYFARYFGAEQMILYKDWCLPMDENVSSAEIATSLVQSGHR